MKTNLSAPPRGVQLALGSLPLDPVEVSKLVSHERASLYAAAGLHAVEIAVAEEAVRAVLRGKYGRKVSR